MQAEGQKNNQTNKKTHTLDRNEAEILTLELGSFYSLPSGGDNSVSIRYCIDTSPFAGALVYHIPGTLMILKESGSEGHSASALL